MSGGRYIYLFLLLMFCKLISHAQDHKFRFSSINTVGWLKGETRSVVQLQTVNGVRYSGFFAGIGVAADPYYFESIPLFIDLRKNIFDKKNSPFVYFDLGTNLPLDKSKNYDRMILWLSEYDAGLYYDVGLGYGFELAKQTKLVLSLGYSEKRLTETQYYHSDPGPDSKPTILDYSFRRISLKAGIQF